MKKISTALSFSILTAISMGTASADPIKKPVVKDPCSAIFKTHALNVGHADRSPANSPCSLDGGPIDELIQKIKSMPMDQKIREGFLALTLPMPIGPLTALLDAYAMEKTEQKKLEYKGKIDDLLKKYHLGKYATGEMMMKRPLVGTYLYLNKSPKRIPAEAIKGAKDSKNEKKVQEMKIVNKSI